MTVAGDRLGLGVFVFTPDDVDEEAGRIRAWVYLPSKRVWGRRWTKLPDVVFDRARLQRNERFARLLEFRRKFSHLTFLNRPLRNKWVIYRTLGHEAEFRKHLPATRLYESPQDLQYMIKRHPTVYFKPINGTGGRGILRIDRLRGGTLYLQGRDHRRTIVQPRKIRRDALVSAVRSWDLRGDRYIVQQGLQIKLPNGRVHDYRMLVQTNGRGEWEVTGCAGRVGPRNSITSNLHGGGTAVSMESLLREWITDEQEIERIRSAAEKLGLGVAASLERTYGALCELALDLAIDRRGGVWLLEVNPKPSREVFLRAGEPETYRHAVQRPVEYALWVYRQKKHPGRVKIAAAHETEADAVSQDDPGA